jgi:thymidylate synthase
MKGIPVLHAEGDSIARAWENSLIALHAHGCTIKTQYDKPEDPPSKDATMVITITDPLSEPMIHKDFPGGQEVALRHPVVCHISKISPGT